MIRTSLWMGLLLTGMLLVRGCVKADIKTPENLMGTPPPSSSIAPADPDNRAELLRESRQLRDRVDYLEEQNRRSAEKLRDFQRKAEEMRDEVERVSAQRDRYRQAAGQ